MKKVFIFLLCSLMLVSCSSRKQGTVELDSVFGDEPVIAQSTLPSATPAENFETEQESVSPSTGHVYETNDDVPAAVTPKTVPSEHAEDAEKSEAAKNTPAPANNKLSADSLADDASVWISKSGKKYHSVPDCSNMTNATEITKADAEKKGKTPCKKCFE